MFKAIIFDFDGVILESAGIKTRAFKMLFADYPDKVAEIIDYHNKNAGISRYVKFRHIYENILGMELSQAREEELGKRFSEIALEEVLKARFVPGAPEFLGRNNGYYNLFIASGTPQEELQHIIVQRELGSFFREAHGTPKGKAEIIEDILERHGFRRDEAVFVGDAESDLIAAEKVGVHFVARISPDNQELQQCRWQISDLGGLDNVLNNIDAAKGVKNR